MTEEEQRAYRRAYYLKNRDRERAQQRAYKEQRRGELAARQREYARDHRAEYTAYHREWRARNRERSRQLGVLNYMRRRAGVDAHAREYVPILRGDPCSYCGGAAGEVDHIDAAVTSLDGSWENLTAACRNCNARKSDKPLLLFLAQR